MQSRYTLRGARSGLPLNDELHLRHTSRSSTHAAALRAPCSGRRSSPWSRWCYQHPGILQLGHAQAHQLGEARHAAPARQVELQLQPPPDPVLHLSKRGRSRSWQVPTVSHMGRYRPRCTCVMTRTMKKSWRPPAGQPPPPPRAPQMSAWHSPPTRFATRPAYTPAWDSRGVVASVSHHCKAATRAAQGCVSRRATTATAASRRRPQGPTGRQHLWPHDGVVHLQR
jgi:hypothetical protein